MPSLFRRVTKSTAILINILTGLFFLTGASVRHFNVDHYWFLSLFTFLLPYFIFLLLFFLFFWIFVRPWWSLISVLFLVLGWHAVINIIPFRLPYEFQMKKADSTIRIMSWNVEQLNIQQHKEHPERLEQMLKLINLYDPDIACLQEVVAGENKHAINYLPRIDSVLNFSDHFFAYKLKDDFDRYHHFGTIIYSKFPIIHKQFMVNNPDDYNSTFQFVDVLIGTDTVRIFNVHLQSLKFSKENRGYLDSLHIKTTASDESKSIVKKIKAGILRRAVQANFVKDEMNHTPYPVILCGDFNDVPVSYAYETIGKNMQNAFVKKGYGISNTFDGIAPTLRIDNIFADSNFVFTQYKKITKFYSDHFPVVADLKLKKE